MNYTTLAASIRDLAEYNFEDSQIELFVKQTESFVYNTFMFPALRKNAEGTMTAAQPYLSVPTDFIYVFSLAVIDGDSNYSYVINKDVNFIREAYPNRTATGLPKYYAIFDLDSLMLGPTPTDSYLTELHYGYYPESIVTAENTWLGDTFDNVLLNGAMVEAARFNKLEPDVIAVYSKMFQQSIKLFGNLTTGRLRSDTYRSGQTRQPAK